MILLHLPRWCNRNSDHSENNFSLSVSFYIFINITYPCLICPFCLHHLPSLVFYFSVLLFCAAFHIFNCGVGDVLRILVINVIVLFCEHFVKFDSGVVPEKESVCCMNLYNMRLIKSECAYLYTPLFGF